MKIIDEVIRAFHELFALPRYASVIRVGNNWILNEPRIVRGINKWLLLDSPSEQYTIEVTASDLAMLTEASIDTAKKLYEVISEDKGLGVWTVTIPCYGKLSIDDDLLIRLGGLMAKTRQIEFATAEEIINLANIYEVTAFIAARLRIEWKESDTLNLPMSLYSRFFACLNEEQLGGEGRFFPSTKSIKKVLI